MQTKIICLLSLTAICLPLAMQAQAGNNQGKQAGKGATPEAILARLDTDQNGTLSKDEVRGRMADRFDSLDTNSDGVLSADELTATREQAQQRMGEKKQKIKDADTDGNRAISIDEAAEAGMEKLVEHFAAVDINGDGEVSREEMRTFRKANKNRKGASE